jgi:ectoine hydroxylase-related dioxygenase (phytanoyl-CoA dioxygenase family)
VLVKEPGTTMITPWHQDAPVWFVAGKQNVSFWIPLDPVSKNNALRCIAGSHRWERFFKPRRFDGTAFFESDERPELPDFRHDSEKFPVLEWALAPGDAVAFTYNTVHGAPGNNASSTQRRVISLRWFGDDATFTDHSQAQRNPSAICRRYSHLGLKPGDPLDLPEFPLLFYAT